MFLVTLLFMCLVVLGGGHPVDMLVDTGSAVTLVHCHVLEKAKTDFKLGMVSEPVVSANGQPLDIKGKCELEIFIFLGGVSVVHPVLVVADVMQDCMLGIHCQGKHNGTIDLNGRSIKIGKEVVSLKGKSEPPNVFRINKNVVPRSTRNTNSGTEN